MGSDALKSLLTDTKVLADLGHLGGLEGLLSSKTQRAQLDLLLKGRVDGIGKRSFGIPEAIILSQGRPSLLIKDGTWEPIKLPELRKRVAAAADALKRVIPRVGRIEIVDSEEKYFGTGWMIEEDVMVTNRHVAELFALRQGASFSFRPDAAGQTLKVQANFLREHERPAQLEARVLEVLFVDEDSATRPDMALIRLDRSSIKLPEPIELDSSDLMYHDDIAVIGYPAADPRNDFFAMQEIFRNVFGVKRLSPGWLSGLSHDRLLLQHDASTLGGSSGGVVIKLATGKACGLHFSGSYMVKNLAVTSAALRQRLVQIGRTIVPVPAPPEPHVGADVL